MHLTKAQLYKYLPHKGAMCLLDEVVTYDHEKIKCVARSHLLLDNPLRMHGSLSSIHTIEYAAQAIGIHGALSMSTEEISKGGYLVSVRNVEIFQANLDSTDEPLIIEAEKLMANDTLWIYFFKVFINDLLISSGRASIMTTRDE